MLKILVLIVSSVILSSSLCAKEFPLDRKMEITISNHATTVFEFPFLIQDKRFDNFRKVTVVKKTSLSKTSAPNGDTSVSVPQIRKEVKIVDGKKVIVKKRIQPKSRAKAKAPIKITVSKNGNIMELRPNTTGKTKAIIWGFKHYPVMITINVVKDDLELNDYYKFVDYVTPKNEIKKFESARHEVVIKNLLLSGYQNITPKGYSKTLRTKVERGSNYKLTQTTVLQGSKYLLRTYELINTSKERLPIEEKMFYVKGRVYSVSIEKLKNSDETRELYPYEKTRVFVVEKREG